MSYDESESSAESLSKGEDEQEEEVDDAAEAAADVPPAELITIPEGFAEIAAQAGALDASTVRDEGNSLILFKLPPNFNISALDGKKIAFKKHPSADGTVGEVELDEGRFSLIATTAEEYARSVNAFPLGDTGYRLGVPFVTGLTLTHATTLPPVPSAEAASDGGGARDKPRPHPPLKLRWRPPGATVAPHTPALPEALRRKQRRLSVHFDETVTPTKTGKRANQEDSPATDSAKKHKSKDKSPDAKEKTKKKHKHNASSPAPPTPATPLPNTPKVSPKDSKKEASQSLVVSLPPSKKSKSKEKQ